jgi:hypothetical protein
MTTQKRFTASLVSWTSNTDHPISASDPEDAFRKAVALADGLGRELHTLWGEGQILWDFDEGWRVPEAI